MKISRKLLSFTFPDSFVTPSALSLFCLALFIFSSFRHCLSLCLPAITSAKNDVAFGDLGDFHIWVLNLLVFFQFCDWLVWSFRSLPDAGEIYLKILCFER